MIVIFGVDGGASKISLEFSEEKNCCFPDERASNFKASNRPKLGIGAQDQL